MTGLKSNKYRALKIAPVIPLTKLINKILIFLPVVGTNSPTFSTISDDPLLN